MKCDRCDRETPTRRVWIVLEQRYAICDTCDLVLFTQIDRFINREVEHINEDYGPLFKEA